MKKSKLIATLCTLVLTIVCLTFGVYSAVKTSFTASGTITFNAYECDFDVKVTASNLEGADKVFYGSNFIGNTARPNFSTGSKLLAGVTDLRTGSFDLSKLAVPELDESKDNLILIKFEFYNYSQTQIVADANITTICSSKLWYTKTAMCLLDKSDGTTPTAGDFTLEIRPRYDATALVDNEKNISIASTVKSIKEIQKKTSYNYFDNNGDNQSAIGDNYIYGQIRYNVDSSTKTATAEIAAWGILNEDGRYDLYDDTGTNVVATTIFGYKTIKATEGCYMAGNGWDRLGKIGNIPYGIKTLSGFTPYPDGDCYLPSTCESFSTGGWMSYAQSPCELVLPESLDDIECDAFTSCLAVGCESVKIIVYAKEITVKDNFSGYILSFISFDGSVTIDDISSGELGSQGAGIYT